MDAQVYDQILLRLKSKGFDLDKIQKTVHLL